MGVRTGAAEAAEAAYAAPEPFFLSCRGRQLLNHGPDLMENLQNGPD